MGLCAHRPSPGLVMTHSASLGFASMGVHGIHGFLLAGLQAVVELASGRITLLCNRLVGLALLLTPVQAL